MSRPRQRSVALLALALLLPAAAPAEPARLAKATLSDRDPGDEAHGASPEAARALLSTLRDHREASQGPSLRIAIAYVASNPTSRQARDRARESFQSVGLQEPGEPAVAIGTEDWDLERHDALASSEKEIEAFDAIYLALDPDYPIDSILSLAVLHELPIIATASEWLERGAALAVVPGRKEGIRVLLNWANAKAQGLAFRPRKAAATLR